MANTPDDQGDGPLRPLDGFTVGVTADRRGAEQVELLARRGAKVLHGPTISTEYLGDEDALRRATEALLAHPPQVLVATTGIGIRAWFEAAQTYDLFDPLLAVLQQAKVVARGAKAASVLSSWGLTVWAKPASERLEDVVDLLLAHGVTGQRIAFQEHGSSTTADLARLDEAGADVVVVPVYRWRLAEPAPAMRLIEAVCAGEVDAVTFTSAPAVTNLFTIADLAGRGDALRTAFNSGVQAACVGHVCGGAALAEGIERPMWPDVGRLGLLVRQVTEHLSARRRTVALQDGLLVLQGAVVVVDGAVVELAPKERSVLHALAERPGVVVSRTALLERCWDEGADDRALEATITRLRRRLGPVGRSLVAVPRRGYRLVPAG